MEEQTRKSVLFLGIHNAARSQMAEGLLKHFRGDKYEAFSAGVEPTDIDPKAAEVMREIGIDIVHCQSKPVSYFNAKQFDVVISICSSTSEARPEYPNGTTQLSWDFPNPSHKTGTEQQVLDEYRKLRDELTLKIKEDLLSTV